MVDHAPFFDVNRQVVLKVLNSCRISVNQGAQVFPGQNALMADLNTLDILCIMSKYINRQIMMAVPKVILFVHKNGRI